MIENSTEFTNETIKKKKSNLLALHPIKLVKNLT